jgi:hypothetical protein
VGELWCGLQCWSRGHSYSTLEGPIPGQAADGVPCLEGPCLKSEPVKDAESGGHNLEISGAIRQEMRRLVDHALQQGPTAKTATPGRKAVAANI